MSRKKDLTSDFSQPILGTDDDPISKREDEIRSAFMEVATAALRPRGFVLLRHEDVRTGGIPDLSSTGLGRTRWWEFKHGTPYFKSPGNQELMMMRLSVHGYARYIIWRETPDEVSTSIVKPVEIFRRGRQGQREFFADHRIDAHDHHWLVEHILRAHFN